MTMKNARAGWRQELGFQGRRDDRPYCGSLIASFRDLRFESGQALGQFVDLDGARGPF
jgi:hypothetical protein